MSAETGEALALEILVTQLGLNLQKVQRRVVVLEGGKIQGGPTAQYEQNNRRGAGASNFTGD